MNKELQQIKIAEACGWTAEQNSNGYWRAVNKKHGNAVELWLSEQNVWSLGIPDYLNDLNAMHEAEEVLDCNQWEQWHRIVVEWQTDLARLTAAQRAEAFLKTLGLWEEEE